MANYAKMPLGNLYQYEYERPRFASCQVISISGHNLVAVSAQPTWAKRQELLGESLQSMLVGFIDDGSRYFPTIGEYREGAYEDSGFCGSFSVRHKERSLPSLSFKRFIQKTLLAENRLDERSAYKQWEKYNSPTFREIRNGTPVFCSDGAD